MSNTSTPLRLEFADDLFARRHRGAGSPVATQLVWVLPALPEAAAVEQVVTRLARGALARQVVRRRLPLARDLWTRLDHPPVDATRVVTDATSREPVADGDRLTWLRERLAVPIDPHARRPYDLALVRTADGGAMASLVACHGVADGAAVLTSFVGEPRPVAAAPTGTALLRADLADARAQAGQIRRWVAARGERARRAAAAAATGSSPSLPSPAEPARRRPGMAVVQLDPAAVSRVVRELGGSRGALLSALLAQVAVAIGRVPEGAAVPVAIPVSVRTPGDDRANSTRIARAVLPAEALRERDLAAVRLLSETAYADLEESPRELEPVPLAAIQALPDAVVRRLPQPPAAAVLASNLGRLAPEVTRAFGIESTGMLAMAMHTRDATDELLATGGGVMGWLADAPGSSTLTVVVADPARTPDDTGLARLLRDELAGWGLEGRAW